MSYRSQFEAPDSAQAYETVQYAASSHSDLLWQLEKEQLNEIVSGLRATHTTIACLDFACGTGRVLEHLEDLVDSSSGVDISAAMASIAAEKVRSPIVCADITVDDAKARDGYDLITAFRFFLNAEPSLRTSVMRALADRLRDDSSLLVFNNHGNLASHKSILWPIHRIRRGGRHRPEGNYMTHRQVVALVEEASLEIVQRRGCGVLPGRLAPHVSIDHFKQTEKHLSGGALARIGVNQMYVVRRRRSPTGGSSTL